jgi:hypothetical protein
MIVCRRIVFALAIVALGSAEASGQLISQRGFAEVIGAAFGQQTPNDSTRAVGDVLLREEVFAKPLSWLQLAVGADARANTHSQVSEDWKPDLADRGVRRPPLSLRRAAATVAYRGFTVDIGKQFIRWGKADILNPTDRFAPRDYLTVVDTEFLPVTGVRASFQATEADAIEAVWVPRFTPSRLPLLNQRWTAVPATAPVLRVVDEGAEIPAGSQSGLRWSHVGDHAEYSLSWFDGFNHLPTIGESVKVTAAGPTVSIVRQYPSIRSYGADAAIPTPWMTVKAEGAYVTSRSTATDEYMLYVVQLERQTGEWLLVGGYAGEIVTDRRSAVVFAPDRGLAGSFVGRASYTIDSNRSLVFEAAVRQTLAGAYWKAEYSQAYGQHWRATLDGVVIEGHQTDFLGQYHRNSHVSLGIRCSF